MLTQGRGLVRPALTLPVKVRQFHADGRVGRFLSSSMSSPPIGSGEMAGALTTQLRLDSKSPYGQKFGS